jgi:DNA-binding NtrC family response regulator
MISRLPGDGIGIAHLYYTVTEILLCSNNPILVKSLHGILRDEGYFVDIADYPAMAVQRVFEKGYSAVIMDPEPFGLSVEDAIRIIKTIRPQMLVIFVGYDSLGADVLSIEAPVDLEEFRRSIQNISSPGVSIPTKTRSA